MTRRSLVGASLVAASAVRGTAQNSAITVGVLGTGSRGTYVSTLMAKNTPARVVALCDVFPEKMEHAKSRIGVENPRLYQDFRKMLASDIDAVIIATPVFLHADHFEAALKAGKHIYIEKPASVDVDGCKRIMRASDAADQRGATVQPQLGFASAANSRHAGREAQRSIDSNSMSDYREKLEVELTEMRNSEMWQAGHTVRSLRPERQVKKK